MNGVEILASNEVLTSVGTNWTYFWITLGIVMGVGSIIGFIAGYITDDCVTGLFAGFLCSIFLGVLIGFAVGDIYGTHAYITEYQVTLSDEVSMAEFTEKYEVIGQNGKIFTVIEKESSQ